MKPVVLVTHPLYRSALEAIEARYDALRVFDAPDPERIIADNAERIRAIAGSAASADLIVRLPSLEIIANFGVGYDAVDTVAARARGIAVTNTPDVLNDAVAELAMGLMLALARRIPHAHSFVADGRWAEGGFGLTGELNGKTLGILGLGRIGKEIAARAQAMKMRVIYHSRNRQDDQPYVYNDNLAEMARDADWLVIVAPGGESTRGIVSREVLKGLGPEGAIVNLGRGTLVDEAAMLELLEAKQLGGAALDVYLDEPRIDPRFFALENVILSPHQGSATHQTRHKMGMAVVRNLDAHFAGQVPPNRVV